MEASAVNVNPYHMLKHDPPFALREKKLSLQSKITTLMRKHGPDKGPDIHLIKYDQFPTSVLTRLWGLKLWFTVPYNCGMRVMYVRMYMHMHILHICGGKGVRE